MDRMTTLPDHIAELEKELFKLRQQYEANPRSWDLGLRTGRLEARLRNVRSAPARAAEAEAERVFRLEDRARIERRMARPLMSMNARVDRTAVVIEVHRKKDLGAGVVKEWTDFLRVCPQCHGRDVNNKDLFYEMADGTAVAVAEDGLQCNLCNTMFKIDQEA